MISEYRYVNGKIVALDEEKGLKVFNYQDNIEELLKQKNVIQTILENINILKKERKQILEEKKLDDLSLIFNKKYCGKSFIYIMFAFLLVFADIGLGTNSLLLKISALVSAISFIPSFCREYKKYKNDLSLKVTNIDMEINELRELFNKESMKLNQLKNNKAINTTIQEKESISIDNSKNETLSRIEKRKQIYQFYRDNLPYIKNDSELEKMGLGLPGNDFSELEQISTKTKKLQKRKK